MCVALVIVVSFLDFEKITSVLGIFTPMVFIMIMMLRWFGTVNSVVYVKIFPWRFLDEYDINAIRANIALDMVSGMYDYMALRETNSC